MLPFLTALVVCVALVQPLYAIIVWEGKIVPAWPDQQPQTLKKRAAGSSLDAATGGFGYYPHPTGTIYGITIIIDFSDQPAKFSKEQATDWLNKPGFTMGATNGSVRDYFYACSNGKLELHNDVFGYYRAKKPKSYYENSTNYATAGELVKECIDYFDLQVDFSKYDNDSDGTTESISFVYAGSGKTWGQGLWPHSGSVGLTRDGVNLGRYNMCDMGENLSLYVFCHETGHMLFGWPDLYWFGDYCLMGNRMNDVNPVPINDFFRADQGWIAAEAVTAATNANLQAWSNGTSYYIRNPAKPNEMLFWSVVINSGRWKSLRGKGLLLYRFDASLRNNSSGTHRTLYVVEADGNNAMAAEQWPSPGSAATDFFYQENRNEYSATTNPASLWGLRIYNISAAADTMQFSVGTKPVAVRPEVALPVMVSKNQGGALFDLRGARVRGGTDAYGNELQTLPSGVFIRRVSAHQALLLYTDTKTGYYYLQAKP